MGLRDDDAVDPVTFDTLARTVLRRPPASDFNLDLGAWGYGRRLCSYWQRDSVQMLFSRESYVSDGGRGRHAAILGDPLPITG